MFGKTQSAFIFALPFEKRSFKSKQMGNKKEQKKRSDYVLSAEV